ncbi:aminoglycoside phosphotransferase family protein [Winogradskya consettensis]|uniref:Phosphotransferase n=1 Tax=Winogradskya consettensis TaxID=113560 RepID=A0A919VKM8_9ACTN|nr:aminoglycoside phosphotransferase family protein [Actinoplanes consettensis]GIM66760.1 phosphotransferase [Actinoplanes consettensis]
MKMHKDQLDIPIPTVAALVAAQFPAWQTLPVRPLPSTGTVNALFRLGDDIVLRFPLLPADVTELRTEQENARHLAPHLTLQVPEPLALGEPGFGYPGPWTAYRWIAGDPVTTLTDPQSFATDLAAFVTELHAIDTGGRSWPGEGRGGPLHTEDAYVRQMLAECATLTDTTALARIWSDCLAAPAHPGPAVWLHADLMPGNLLTRNGSLAAVIDLGAANIGDPAVDLMPAWNLLPPKARPTYRKASSADDARWQRGKGWALIQAIGALPYYQVTNPAMAATARHTLNALLE